MDMGNSTEKEILRDELMERRKALPEHTYLEYSSRIISSLTSLQEYSQAGTVHCYVSLNDRNEVNTLPLIKELCENEKKLVVPVTDFETGKLHGIYLDDYESLKENKWGVKEPEGGKQASPSDYDLVVVPMVGGDRHGNRIGYGKGFYDRFLSSVDCPKIGLLFEACLLDHVPSQSFDIPMDLLITENAVIRP